jgi:hypothetical protein
MDKQNPLKEIKESLAGLKEPYTLEKLSNIFIKYEQLFAESYSLQDTWYHEWQFFNDLYQYYRHWQNFNTKTIAFRKWEAKLKARNKKEEEIMITLADLQVQFNQLNESIAAEFQTLLNAYNKDLIIQNPLFTPRNAHDLASQSTIIKEYHDLLLTNKDKFTYDNARLKLHNNEKERYEIVKHLQQYNIIVASSCSVEELNTLREKIIQQQQVMHKNKKIISDFHEQFTQYLSKKNVLLAVKDLCDKKQEIAEELSKIKNQLAEIEQKQQLAIKSQEVPQATGFFDKLREDLVKPISYLNPISWPWLTEKGLRQQFEALIAKHQEICHQQDNINRELLKQNSILDSISNQKIHDLTEQRPAEIMQILSLRSSEVILLDDNELFEKLIACIGTFESQIKKYENALKLLDKLSKIENETGVINQQFFSKIQIGTYSILDDEEAKNLAQSIMQQKQNMPTLEDHLLACTKFETSLHKLLTLAQKIEETKKLLSAHPKKNQKLSERRIEAEKERAAQIICLQETIANHISEFKKEYLQTQLTDTDNQKSILVKQLNDWNERIAPLCKSLPHALRDWYTNLFLALQNAASKTNLLQSIQLLRDIYFELTNINQDEVSQILWEYHFLCPSPSINFPNLLKLKPEVAIEDSNVPLPSLQNTQIQKKIDELYRHQQQRSTQFPKEAALLNQATWNLHQIALARENKVPGIKELQASQLNFYRDDPRYKCLEKHRGFGKIWEWLAELCITILRKLKNNCVADYQQSFFFIPTKSKQLLDSVEYSLETTLCQTS